MDCREGKELKQATCRYVKKCKPGWTRNEKFICRKTARRVGQEEDVEELFEPKRNSSDDDLEELFQRKQQEESNENVLQTLKTRDPKSKNTKKSRTKQTPNASESRKPRTKKQTFAAEPSRKPRSKKTKVGNFITYTHPDGRKERAKVTGIRDGKYELHIPSLGDEWVKQGAARFKKGETVFYMYRTGMREKSIVKKVINGGEMYEVYLTSQQIYKTVPEKKLRKLDSFEENIPKGFSYTASQFKKGELVNYVHSNGMKEQARIEKVINDGELYQVYLFTDDETVTVADNKLRKLDSFSA